MLELITLLVTAVATGAGYFKTRGFVRRRLAYVDAMKSGAAPVLVGAGAALVAAPVVALLPLVGTGTAIFFGVGVGAGVAAGARDTRRKLPTGWR